MRRLVTVMFALAVGVACGGGPDSPDARDIGGADAGACGHPGQPCCSTGVCWGGGCCVWTGTRDPPIPTASSVCAAAGSTCPDVGGTCGDGSCGNCGSLGQMCCPGDERRGVLTACTSGGTLCAPNATNGRCVACGGAGQPCCLDEQCGPGFTCGGAACVPCGGNDQPCCAGNVCGAGNLCTATGNCAACGDQGQPCCEGSTCNTGRCTDYGVCDPCGASGQACCIGESCNSGLQCCVPPAELLGCLPDCGD